MLPNSGQFKIPDLLEINYRVCILGFFSPKKKDPLQNPLRTVIQLPHQQPLPPVDRRVVSQYIALAFCEIIMSSSRACSVYSAERIASRRRTRFIINSRSESAHLVEFLLFTSMEAVLAYYIVAYRLGEFVA